MAEIIDVTPVIEERADITPEQLERLIEVNQNLGKQNTELKTDLATVVTSFKTLQGVLPIGDGDFSATKLMGLFTNKKKLAELGESLKPLLEVVAKYAE